MTSEIEMKETCNDDQQEVTKEGKKKKGLLSKLFSKKKKDKKCSSENSNVTSMTRTSEHNSNSCDYPTIVENSCIKGSRQRRQNEEDNADNDVSESPSPSTKRSVHFNEQGTDDELAVRVHEIETLFAFESDIWWTREEEMLMQRIDPLEDKTYTKKQIDFYFKSYQKSRSKVFSSMWDENDKPQPTPPTEIPKKLYKDLAKAQGYSLAGYEQFKNEFKAERTKRIADFVKIVIAAHNKCIKKGFPQQARETQVYKCSLMVSESDRYWASVIGNVQQEAAYQDE